MGKSTVTAKTAALEPFMCGIPLKPIEGDPLKDEQVEIVVVTCLANSPSDGNVLIRFKK